MAKKKNKVMKWVKKYLKKEVIIMIVIAIALTAVVMGVGNSSNDSNQTNKLTFEDIGELATQVAYATNTGVMDKSRNIWGIKIPFTQSKYIYSYKYIIKAGMNFEEIQFEINDLTKTINVDLPEIKVLTNEVDLNSFKVYHEEESIFRQITISEQNEQTKKMQEEAQKDAIENGLLIAAEENARALVRMCFAQYYDLTEYKIVYK